MTYKGGIYECRGHATLRMDCVSCKLRWMQEDPDVSDILATQRRLTDNAIDKSQELYNALLDLAESVHAHLKFRVHGEDDLTANAWSLRAGGLRDLLSRSERTLKTSAINMHAIPVQGPLELRIRALREALELFDKRTVCGDYPEDDHASLSEAVEKLRTLIKEAEQELQNRPAGHLIVPEAGSKS